MYRFIWHIGKDLYYCALHSHLMSILCSYKEWEIEYEVLTAEEIGQLLGGN